MKRSRAVATAFIVLGVAASANADPGSSEFQPADGYVYHAPKRWHGFGTQDMGLYRVALHHWGAGPWKCEQVHLTTGRMPSYTMRGLTIRRGGDCTVRIARSIWGVERCLTIVHEVGHLVGLRHTQNPADVMYPTITPDKHVAACNAFYRW